MVITLSQVMLCNGIWLWLITQFLFKPEHFSVVIGTFLCHRCVFRRIITTLQAWCSSTYCVFMHFKECACIFVFKIRISQGDGRLRVDVMSEDVCQHWGLVCRWGSDKLYVNINGIMYYANCYMLSFRFYSHWKCHSLWFESNTIIGKVPMG